MEAASGAAFQMGTIQTSRQMEEFCGAPPGSLHVLELKLWI